MKPSNVMPWEDGAVSSTERGGGGRAAALTEGAENSLVIIGKCSFSLRRGRVEQFSLRRGRTEQF